ncbi:MAG: nicotinate-nucleotide--dimethylbenzimidazole phosphoribosyltransferase [Clostridiales bacterium]|nr:nicotinate-nucleotide--dimethylbenzimidazole phosphoribosyltransferase [Clostridiales bacterium]
MNYEEALLRELTHIAPADAEAMARAAVYQGTLAKPPGSLGELENIYIRLCGIAGTLHPRYAPCRVVVLCADNGVTEEGVSVTPRSVTAAQAVNMTKYLTGMSAMAHHFGDEVQVVDVGIAAPYQCPAIVNRKILSGTRNFAKEPAMTRGEAAHAVCVGMELAAQAKRDGVAVLGVGEMGIGNTTTSSAVLAALTGLSVERVTGRGGGMTDEGFALKKRVIASALVLHKPNGGDVLDTLCKVGGLDIAAMCGVFLGAARCRLPAVIDGLISAVAALCAVRLCPAARDYLFASHLSREIGYQAAIKELGLAPWLHLGMRLGEGSGCPIAFRVLESACAAAEGMATFQGAAIDDSYLSEIRGKDCF